MRVQVQDAVRGSDHGEIGEVKEVVATSDEHDAHLVVPRGLVFEKDTYIPLDAVVRRSGSDLFVNVPKLVVGSMPWSEPPRRSERREKQGPAASTVEKLYRSHAPTSRADGSPRPA